MGGMRDGPRKYIYNFSFPTLFSACWYTKGQGASSPPNAYLRRAPVGMAPRALKHEAMIKVATGTVDPLIRQSCLVGYFDEPAWRWGATGGR